MRRSRCVPDFVLLPDEPYAFGPKDVEALKPLLPPPLSRRVVLINGRDLHWYGVRMVNGLKSLATLLVARPRLRRLISSGAPFAPYCERRVKRR